jgi:crossover junction endodeoxyribonuclease RuvC
MDERIVLAIDPGYDRMGWAVGSVINRKLEVLEYGCITTAAKDDLQNRFSSILADLSLLCQKYHPTEMALETLFFSKNQTTAMAVSEVRGLLKTVAIQQKMKVAEYQPNSIKIAVTGAGNANKAAVKKMVELQLKIKVPSGTVDDTLDALALLLTHTAIVK